MSLAKLARQLRREVVRSPKKAAVLGLLFLVAIYFWAPLLSGLAPGNGEADDRADMAASTGGSLAEAGHRGTEKPTTKPDGEAETPTYDWIQLDSWITQDPTTAAAGDLPSRRDPFHEIRPEVVEVVLDEPEPEDDDGKIALEDLNVELTSTVVGRRRSVAIINGRPYRQGETIELSSDGHVIDVILAEVHPRSAVLLWQDQRFELTMPQSTLAQSIR